MTQRMLTMTNAHTIREMFFKEGRNITEIANCSGFTRKTIRKYINQEDWNHSHNPVDRQSILDPFKAIIDEWIENDKSMRQKQRHTAWRVYIRLKEEQTGFDASYKTVANYVKKSKKRVYGNQHGSLPLVHIPGEAQADFGHADFIENGTRYSGTYLSMTFPYSNTGYFQMFRGESFECLGEGLKSIFEYIGFVPNRIWFDNASVMVKKVLKEGERDLTDAFLRFKSHYQFDAVFCNPNSGNEKGNVENKVGYHRRNMMVPIPKFDNLEEYNKQTFKRCDQDNLRNHYQKNEPFSMLFEDEKKACIPLPPIELDICSFKSVRINGYGKFTLNNGKHTYSSTPSLAGKQVMVCKRAHDITVLDENMRDLVRHKRLYGDMKQESMDWIPYLKQLSRHPMALKYTGIFNLLPDSVKDWMGGLKRSECGQVLKVLSKLTDESDFETAVQAFDRSVRMGIKDLDSVQALFSRYNSTFPEMEQITLSRKIPVLSPISTNTDKYDQMLSRKESPVCL